MNLTPLFEAASGSLARWLTQAHREVVDLRATSAERRYTAGVAILEKLADDWSDKAEAMPGSDRINWALINRNDLGYVLSDIMDEHGPRLDRSYPMTAEGRLDILEAWARKRATSEKGMVELWTDAPKDYDHGYTRRTGEVFQSKLLRKPLYRVLVPQQYVQGQAARYSSGLHAAFDAERMAEERAASERTSRRETWGAETRRLGAVVREAADLIPAHYDASMGYWTGGVRYEPKYDETTGRSYPRPADVPPSDPARAVGMLQGVLTEFEQLPKDAQKEEWRIKADTEDALRIAKREVARLKEEREAREKKAADEKKRRDTAVRETVKFWEEKYAPILGKLAVVEDRSATPAPAVRGLVTSWPPVDGVFQTESGPVDVEVGRVYDDIDGRGRRYGQKSAVSFKPAPATHVPLTVWQAGAPPDVEINFMPDGAPVFSWRPFAAYEKKVVNADGRTMGKNTMAYAVANKAASAGDESQDAAIDRNVTEMVKALGRPEPGHVYPMLMKTRKGEPLLNVAVIPPAGGKGLVGYVVVARSVTETPPTMRRDAPRFTVTRTAWVREAKATKDRPYLWRVIENTSLPTETVYLNRVAAPEVVAALLKNEPTLEIPPLNIAKVLRPGDEVKLNDGAVPWPVTRAKFGEVKLSNGMNEYSLGEDGVERGTLTFAGPRGAVKVEKLAIVKEAP